MEKKKTKVSDKQKLVTPIFRVAFPNVFTPTAMQGGKPKFSVVMLYPKDSDLTPLKVAMKEAKVQMFGSNKSQWPEIESCVKDGNLPSRTGQIYEGFPEHWAIRATSNENSRPGVFDEDVQPITQPSDFYPGCYAVAYCFAYVWEFQGRYGVGFILDHLQKQRDGKPFGGKKLGTQVFKPVIGSVDDTDSSDDDSFDAHF